MLLMRKFDEAVDELYGSGKIAGTVHLYIGQEAVASGVCQSLKTGDVITSTHRGHGHSLSIGCDPRAMFAEILGRSTGCCGGFGGSMHVADCTRGNLGANGIVGAGAPIAAGAALHFKRMKSDNVAVSFLGDGALNEGCVHEALNIAAIWALPVVFVVENNQYGLSSPVGKMYAIADLAERGPAYGMASFVVDGQDVSAVEEAARTAIDKARSGGGPTLLEMKTYRYRGHSKNDPARYRSRDEVASWRKRDPILLLKPGLFGAGFVQAELDAAEAEIEQTITSAANQADSERFPDPSDILSMVYSPNELPSTGFPTEDVEQATMTYAEAVRWAIGSILTKNENSFLIGEDIGGHGGSFGVTRGLFDVFGSEKVLDSPISEAAIAGLGMGAAMVGARPIVEIQFSDFLTNAMDAVVNQAAKIHFMSGGKTSVPLVIRTPMGGGVGMAAQHSQCLEAWFYHVPGLKVVAPATPDDARGLLLTAVRDNNPVIFFEHKNIYSKKGKVSLTDAGIPFGKATIRRNGTDATIVTYSAMVDVALAAAEILAEQDGFEIEVLDLRTLFPLDWEAIESSVRKTRRLSICHEAVVRGGIGGDIAARICSGPLFRHLMSPILRIGAIEAPVPFSPGLEASVIPDVDKVLTAMRAWLKDD